MEEEGHFFFQQHLRTGGEEGKEGGCDIHRGRRDGMEEQNYKWHV